ncbi:unnamed protein product [Polarella glacialis]|uniref:Band 7 domain-containing protein n=1 Tax=Polarella glacialis TaxID=89957 RepID=A0A813IRC0_POLGL|nr:unnamed protein product [Polarella glacialis]
MQRHMLCLPGRHALMSDEEHWEADVRMDEKANLKREIGIKTILVVAENHLAGAFRVSGQKNLAAEEKASGDGDFVLLSQGRHVLDSSSYRDIVISKLDKDLIQLGPLVLYIKEGFLGGAYERTTGTYRIFQPGPPYLLHEKDYEKITMQERKLEGFKLGPVQFITVREGQMGGAYQKATGLYELLPPGNTYQLHEKDYDCIELKSRSDLFKLGPYTFMTVQANYLAGAYKLKGGEFILFLPGQTYQLNDNEFKEPERVARDRHVVTCGPITFLTLQEGALMGAYRTKDGKFQEFETKEDGTAHFELHASDYHGLTVVNKYSKTVQEFGPNRIVTIPEGFVGVFEREGRIEIKDPGFYRVTAEYSVNENIPLQLNSERFEDKTFRTKDSLRMSKDVAIVWRIQDPLMTAKWPGTYGDLRDEFRTKAMSGLVMLLRCYTRAELLPTRQDVLVLKVMDSFSEAAPQDVEAEIKAAAKASKEVLKDTEESCLQLLNRASEDAGWGLLVVSVKIDSIEVADEQVIEDMEAIAQSQLAVKRKEMEGHAELAEANVRREVQMQQARLPKNTLTTKKQQHLQMTTHQK